MTTLRRVARSAHPARPRELVDTGTGRLAAIDTAGSGHWVVLIGSAAFDQLKAETVDASKPSWGNLAFDRRSLTRDLSHVDPDVIRNRRPWPAREDFGPW